MNPLLHDPTGIAIASNEVFVADSRNGRIQVFDLYGHFKRQLGKPGKMPGELGRPMNLAIHDGELYVPEYFNDRVQVFALDGTPKWIIGSTGSGPGQFNSPVGVAVASNGDLYVADFYNHRVEELKPDGTFFRLWARPAKKAMASAPLSILPTWRLTGTATSMSQTAMPTASRSSMLPESLWKNEAGPWQSEPPAGSMAGSGWRPVSPSGRRAISLPPISTITAIALISQRLYKEV